MDTLFHFIFSIIAGMAIFRGKHRLSAVGTLAFLSVLVDADHFLGMSARATFHNVFVVVLIPFAVFLALFYYNGRKSFNLQAYALILLVMLVGHITADMFYSGGVYLFYPLSDAKISASSLALPSGNIFGVAIENFISRDGIALAIYSVILMLAFFVEDFIYFFEKQHKSMRRAIQSAKRDLF